MRALAHGISHLDGQTAPLTPDLLAGNLRIAWLQLGGRRRGWGAVSDRVLELVVSGIACVRHVASHGERWCSRCVNVRGCVGVCEKTPAATRGGCDMLIPALDPVKLYRVCKYDMCTAVSFL